MAAIDLAEAGDCRSSMTNRCDAQPESSLPRHVLASRNPRRAPRRKIKTNTEGVAQLDGLERTVSDVPGRSRVAPKKLKEPERTVPKENSETPTPGYRRAPLYLQILVALVLGVLAGLALPRGSAA